MGKEVLGIDEEQFCDACLDASGELLDELRLILAEQDNDEIMFEPAAEVGTLGSYARAADILWSWRNKPRTGLQALAAVAGKRGAEGFEPGLLEGVVREAAVGVALGERYQSEQDVESVEHNMREGLLEAWDNEVRTPKGGVPHTAKLLSQERLESLEADVKELEDSLARAPYVFQPDYVLDEWDEYQVDHPAARGVELRQGDTRELCRDAAENLGWCAALQDLCDEQLHAEFDTFIENVVEVSGPTRNEERGETTSGLEKDHKASLLPDRQACGDAGPGPASPGKPLSPALDPKGHAVLDTVFTRSMERVALVHRAGDASPFVVAFGYDPLTGDWSHGSRWSKLGDAAAVMDNYGAGIIPRVRVMTMVVEDCLETAGLATSDENVAAVVKEIDQEELFDQLFDVARDCVSDAVEDNRDLLEPAVDTPAPSLSPTIGTEDERVPWKDAGEAI